MKVLRRKGRNVLNLWVTHVDCVKILSWFYQGRSFLCCHYGISLGARKWGSCGGGMLGDSWTSVRDKKQRKGKTAGLLCEESFGSWRVWGSHTCALALLHGCVLPLPRPLSPQGCLISMPGMVSLLRYIAFTSSGSLGVWDGLCLEITSWMGLPPSFSLHRMQAHHVPLRCFSGAWCQAAWALGSFIPCFLALTFIVSRIWDIIIYVLFIL